MLHKLDPYQRFIVPAFFTLFFIMGCIIFSDYGISWDEQIQRQHGTVTLDYINATLFGDDTRHTEYELQSYAFRGHGTFYQLLCFGIEKITGSDTLREAYLIRHFMVFLISFIGLIFFYLLGLNRFKDWKFALLCVAILVLSPRLFANTFYNPKDSVFLAWFIVSIYMLTRFLKNKSLINAILLGAVSAITINARILGILIPMFIIGFMTLEWIRTRYKKAYLMKSWLPFVCYLIALIIANFIIWPLLWERPIENLQYTFDFMKKHFWETEVLFYGKYVNSTDLPWTYIPGWILVTTPIPYLVFFFIGLLMIFKKWFAYLKKSPFKIYRHVQQKFDLILLAWIIIPTAAVIFLGSTLYDGWRHMYYIYPAIVLVAMVGIRDLEKWLSKKTFGKTGRYKKSFGQIGMIAILIIVAAQMVILHPFENVYFNVMAGRGKALDLRFDQEYWGLSCKPLLEHLVSIDERPSINVYASSEPGQFNANILVESERKRLNYTEFENADYFIYHHRFRDAKNQFYSGVWPFDKPIKEIVVNGITIAGLYDMREKLSQ